jgi:hypothetical protein
MLAPWDLILGLATGCLIGLGAGILIALLMGRS